MSEKIVKGTPPMIMLPAKNYFFKVYEDKHRLTIPRTGKFTDLDPAFYSEESGEFKIYDPETGFMDLAAIGQVLFATQQYPDLEQGQLFVPFSMVLTEEEIHLIGQVIEVMVPVQEKEEETEDDTVH